MRMVLIFHVHSSIERVLQDSFVGKLDGISKEKNDDIDLKLRCILCLNPLALDKENIDKSIVDKELEIIKAEISNSGKPGEMAEKISKGKFQSFK